MRQIQLGDVRIDRVLELEGLGYAPDAFFPDATIEGFEGERDWLIPHFWDDEAKTYIRSIQSFVVRTEHHTVLVDACVGNHKSRPSTPAWDGMTSGWMDQLTGLGVHPEEIDFVLCTHLHADHVGWNTRLADGKWVPTFPNAAYLMDQKELDLFGNIDENTEDDFFKVQRTVFADSVQPVLDAGLAKPIEGPAEVCEGVRLIATPGHTPGHCSVIIESKGESAMITGDFLHHPIQFNDPALVSPFDIDNDAAVVTRRRVFGEYADTPTLIIGTHFAGPTAGKLVRDGDGYRLDV